MADEYFNMGIRSLVSLYHFIESKRKTIRLCEIPSFLGYNTEPTNRKMNPLLVQWMLKNRMIYKENPLFLHNAEYIIDKKKIKAFVEKSIYYQIFYNLFWGNDYKIPYPSEINIVSLSKSHGQFL